MVERRLKYYSAPLERELKQANTNDLYNRLVNIRTQYRDVSSMNYPSRVSFEVGVIESELRKRKFKPPTEGGLRKRKIGD